MKQLTIEQRKKWFHIGYFLSTIIKIIIVIAFLFPFYWMIITSFKTTEETHLFPPTFWPHNFSLGAYETLFQKMNLLSYAKNSIIVTLATIVIQMCIMIPAAYAFAKYEFKGKSICFSLVLVAFMIPTQITFISVYMMMAKAKLLKTLLPQILPFGANAFGIFLLRQSFKQIPEEIIECARMDNASEVKIMYKIMLPMAKSTIVTIAMFSFVGQWNSYFWPLVMTDIESIRPLTIAIDKLRDVEYGINWNIVMAGNVVLVVPILIIFVFASRKIIEAFAYKGVK
jgi:sn-glycerol 3-phosphate transport system permease protein